MLKIYGHFFSAPSNKVRLVASALGIEFSYTHVELTKGEHKTSHFLAVNPVGKVPAIDDDGFYLYESDAIIRYLARKVESDLYPTSNHQLCAHVDQWIDFSYNNILSNMGKILFNQAFAKSMGREPNLESIKEGEKLLSMHLPLIESQLNKTNYLCGAAMSLADIALLASMEPFEFIKFDISDYPSITQWRNQLMQQTFYQNVHQHYAAELPPREA